MQILDIVRRVLININYISSMSSFDGLDDLWMPFKDAFFNCNCVYRFKIINDTFGWFPEKYSIAEKVSRYYGNNFYKKYIF